VRVQGSCQRQYRDCASLFDADPVHQAEVDALMIDLDGTPNKATPSNCSWRRRPLLSAARSVECGGRPAVGGLMSGFLIAPADQNHSNHLLVCSVEDTHFCFHRSAALPSTEQKRETVDRKGKLR
jgi:hypothetical protein